ncbi:MAG: type III-A CRISPR-associated protein Cas10/Csm1 [Candidatus Lokiarchaeota archaeon]|nr:type III-A CRISPR-associated protein Cas10/Csm1 [Candidatus Lokiarchaeota archaeon]
MIDQSKHILLWGIKILAERYWGKDIDKDLIDEAILTKALAFMPSAETLLDDFKTGYKINNQELYALKSIFESIRIFNDHSVGDEKYLQPAFDFQKLNLPVSESHIDPAVFENKSEDFEKFSLETDSETLLNVLQKYGGFLPILNMKDCAMPLFEYVKIAAAIATNPSGDFRFVIGDLSGIQDFIYTISSENALKVLRARSFYLELLTKTFAYDICDDLKLTSANILYAGGGNFLLLLPEIKNLDDRLNKYYEAINSYFIDQFQGSLHMPFAQVKITNSELRNSSENIIQERWNYLFTVELSKVKNKKFLYPNRSGDKKRILIKNLGKPVEVDGKTCGICHADYRNIKLNDENYCPFCEKLKKIGAVLHNLNKIDVVKTQNNDFKIPLAEGENIWPFAKPEENQKRTFNINRLDKSSNSLMFYGNFNTTKENEDGVRVTLEFIDMAKKATGANRIATLAMDVDNMGAIFREKLGSETPQEFLIYAPTLSRMLDYFFKPGLTRICEKPEFKVVRDVWKNEPRCLSVIYSGGDDLLLAGAWSDVAEVALDIQDNFKKFTCNNTDLGISGGMYVSTANFPFYISVKKAKDAEMNFAKKNFGDSGDNKLQKKNSMVFFYDELTSFIALNSQNSELKDRYLLATNWDEVYNHIIEALSMFLDKEIYEVDNNKISVHYSRNFIGKLFDMHKKYLTYPDGVIYIIDLVYNYARMERNIKNKLLPIYEHYMNYQKKELNNPIRFLPVVLNWLELLLREKGE